MGCDQSRMNKPPLSPQRIDRVITIEPQVINGKKVIDPSGRKLASSKSYQSARINMNPMEFEEALVEYKECDGNIRKLEKEDPLTLFYIKKSHLQSIHDASLATEEKIKILQKSMQNGEPGGVKNSQNLKKVVVEYGAKDIISKAEQEYLTSVNRLAILATELEMYSQEKALVESEVSTFKTICTKLVSYYNRQDEISKKLTVGVTNQEEAKLYKELADVETKKIKISEAFQRWKEARLQIIDACRQFGSALKKWREIKDDIPANLYDLTEEVRDDLVVSLQAITNARFYVRSDLPYCSKPEMAVLEKALSYIFIDMNTEERRLHADSCYKAFHNRAVALFAWIDMTIKQVIDPESKRVSEELANVTKKVREVRFRTVQKQFPDVTWKVNDDSITEDQSDNATLTLTDPESIETLAKLDTSQLAQPLSINDIYGKSNAGNDYKSMFKNSMSEMQNGDISDINKIMTRKNNDPHAKENGQDTVGLA